MIVPVSNKVGVNMNERQREMVGILLRHSNRFLLVKDITGELNCSEKTVRNDLKVIEINFESYSSAVLIRKPGLGVCLEINDQDKNQIFRDIQTGSSMESRLEEEDRLVEIAFHLLMSPKAVTVQVLSTKYYVSKSVIKKDLAQLETWLGSFDLTLETKQKVGLTLEGAEKDKRSALARLSELVHDKEPGNDFIKKQFPLHEVAAVTTWMRELQRKYALSLTDDSFERIVIHTLLMIKRTKLQQFISMPEEEVAFLKDQKEYRWSGELLQKLEEAFSIRFPEAERAYLTLHFLGGKFLQVESQSTDKRLSEVVDTLVDSLSQSNEVDFNDDKELVKGLRVHLYSTLNRLKYGLPVSNVMLGEIKKMYPYLFDQILFAIEGINQKHSIEIPEEEAAYLTLHFQASLERLKNQYLAMKKVVIVCHMGIGMSQLLRTKIERKFQTVIVSDCIAHSELQTFLEGHEVDFIISTIPLERVEKPHLVVSPLFDKNDEDKLREKVRQLENPRNTSGESMILSYTDPFLVFPHLAETNKYEIIKKLSTDLFKKGYVEKEYMESAMIRERMAATTVGAGIAIPHGNPKYIKQSVIAVATLKEPVDWGAEKVSLVFLLAVRNDKSENVKKLFKEISLLSEDSDRIQSLIKEENRMQLLTKFKG
jgi:activator of the mannose operon, transcriptional antiterminator